MLKMTKKDKRTNLEKQIDDLFEMMSDELDPDEYEKGVGLLERLYKLKEVDKKDRKHIDPNVIISTFGSIACVILIAAFERDGILSTKSFPFIHKGRA